jgi:sulfite exporter TauE/SafE
VSTAFIITAFSIGLGASVHCIGMCSPLQFAVLLKKDDKKFNISNWSIYQLSRIVVYGFYGLLFGWIGSSIKWFGIQQNISLVAGISMLSVILIIKLSPSIETRLTNNFASSWLRKIISPFIFSDTISSKILAGTLNGVLPCSMVYVALAGATAMQSAFHGILFMVIFGLGTIPMLLISTIIGKHMQSAVKKYIYQWYPYMIGFVAILLIVRGLNMGNIFSPSLLHGSNAKIQCSSR